ncbi:hypothetical protein PENSPDRAFT_49300 [Peniophora sp. CONT]|nr:hypothetical protein PENSPDRAFT_49300 [Peniophora sp. CONT]
MRLIDDSGARVGEQNAAADDATVALEEDLRVTLLRLRSTESELEKLSALHSNCENHERDQTEAIASAQTELHGVLTEARQEVQSRYNSGMAKARKEKEEEKRTREKAESLLQHYLDRMKVAEDRQAHAENSLQQAQVENASVRNTLSACERDAQAKDGQITMLKSDLATITRLHAESETSVVTLRAERAALQDRLAEMRAKAYGERHPQRTTSPQVIRLHRARSDESQTRRSVQRRIPSLGSGDASIARKRLPFAQVQESFGVNRTLNVLPSDHTRKGQYKPGLTQPLSILAKPHADPVIGMKRAATSIPEPMKGPRSKRPRIVAGDIHSTLNGDYHSLVVSR